MHFEKNEHHIVTYPAIHRARDALWRLLLRNLYITEEICLRNLHRSQYVMTHRPENVALLLFWGATPP